jgi:hypothetical protein
MLKSVARKIARAQNIKYISALEIVAKSLGFPHWNALTVAKKKGLTTVGRQLGHCAGLDRVLSFHHASRR